MRDDFTPFIFLGILAVFFFALLHFSGLGAFADLNHYSGRLPVGGDFWQFWSGARLVLEGNAIGVYQSEPLSQVMATVSDFKEKFAPLYYPPHYLFILAPFGAAPYFTGFLCFFFASLLLLAGSLWLWARNSMLVLALLGLGAVWHNFPTGQNGLLTASLVGFVFYALERRPSLAGTLIGLLTIKPQLGLLWPIMLAVERRWKVLIIAFATALLLAGAATLAFGVEVWSLFLTNLASAKNALAQRPELWKQTASLYSFLRSLGLADAPAFAAQLLLSITVLTLAPLTLKKLPDPLSRLAFFATASLLAAPFAYNYDLAWLVWPVLYLLSRPIAGPWRWAELFFIAFAYFYPGLSISLNEWVSVSFGFPLLLGLYFLQLRRIPALPGGLPSR